MDDQAIRDALHTAAGTAVLPDRFRSPSNLVQAARPRRLAGWQRGAIACSLFALITGATLAASPMVLNAAENLMRVVWTGKVGTTPGVVNWIPQDISTQKPPAPQGPDVVVGTVDEAAAKIGFRPTETRYPDARLARVTIRISPIRLGGEQYETRMARLDYMVHGKVYTLTTIGNFHQMDGRWVAIEMSELPAYGASQEPLKNIRTIKVGDHEGIAFEMSQFSQGGPHNGQPIWFTRGYWLTPGHTQRVDAWGPDAKIFEAIAQAATR